MYLILLLKMKHKTRQKQLFLAVLLIIGLLILPCSDIYAQNIKGKFPKETLVARINKIIKSGKSEIAFDADQLAGIHVEALSLDGNTVEQALKNSLANTGFTYKMLSENSFVIVKINKVNSSQSTNKKEVKVEGIVLDRKGDAIVGATIAIKGQATGTTTDIDGKFTLDAGFDSKLVISLLGYISQEVSIGTDSHSIKVILNEDEKLLNEVVVVGYGKTSSKDISSSITSLSEKDFNKGPVTSIAQMLQGKAAGVFISKDGDPNSAGSLVIRGTSTLRTEGQAPLYVVDGIPNAGIVSPQDIVSIDILKDASASAIYGSRAANGVILITTRQGKGGEGKYTTVDSYLNIETVSKRYEMMSGDQYRKYLTDNGSATEPGWDDGVSTDWQKEIMRTGISQNYYLNTGGISGKTRYDASVNFSSQEGIIKTTGQKKAVVRASVDQSVLNDRISFGVTVNGTIANHDLLISPSNVYRSMLTFVPTVNATDENGNYKEDIARRDLNPVALINQTEKATKDEILFGSFRAKAQILEGLDYNLMLSYQNSRVTNSSYVDKASQAASGKNGVAQRNTYLDNSLIIENYLSYNKQLGKHQLGAMAGYSWQEDNTDDGFQTSNINFISDATGYYNIGLGSTPAGYNVDYGTATMRTLRMISFYGRLNYNYDQRYILQASLRRDGSSAFGENNRWGLFPSVSGAWRIISEDFMKNQTLFNDLKLKIGYGISGNSLGFDPLISKLRYGNVGKFYYQGKYINSIGPVQNENNDLKWEKTGMVNIGLDMAFWNSRLRFGVEYYDKRTSDLIWNYKVPATEYLYETLTTNVGKVRNNGIEVTISAIPVSTPSFSWNTTLTLAHNKNEVTSLSNDKFKLDYVLTGTDAIGAGQSGGSAQIIKEGEPLGTFYTLRFMGFNDKGESLFLDKNGKTTESPSAPDDYYAVGNSQPKLNFGWSNNFTYKNFTLDMMFSGVLGHKVLNATLAKLNYTSRVSHYNMPKYVLESGQPFNDIRSHFISDRFIEKADFLRLQSATLSYLYNLNGTSLKSLVFYVNVNNAFVLTKYKGIDPEVNMGGIEPGIDNNNLYPKTRAYQIGVKVNF